MLQYASQWLKKTATVMTLVLTVVSSSVQTVSAFTVVNGTNGGVSTVTPTSTVDPSLLAAIYSPTTGVINNAKATPSTFKPSNGEQTTIHFELAAPATVWLDIMQNGSTVNRLYHTAGIHMNGGAYDTQWNGLDGTGTLVNDGTYQFLITAKLDSTQATYTAQDNIVVTSNSAAQPVVITTGNASPNPFNPSLGQQTYVSYTLNTQANLNIEVVDGNTVLTQLGASPFTQNAGTYQISWNGKVGSTNVAAKTYYIRFTGKNDATPVAYVTTVPVTVDYGTTTNNPKVLYVYAENASFNPNTTTDRIHYAVDSSSTAVVKILDSSNNVVRTFGSSSVTNGYDYFTNWDGRSDSNALVPAGNYTAKIELTNGSSTVVDSKQSSPFAVDYGSSNNTAPVVTSLTVNPSSFNPSNNETTTISYNLDKAATSAMVQILDSNNNVRRTISGTGTSSTTTNTTSFNGRDDSSNILPVGTYTVKVSASNAYGTGTNTTSVTITNNGSNNNAPVVSNVYASPSSFNPSNNESTTIYYTLDKVATSAMVQILDSNNNVRRTISNTGTAASTNNVYFNGRDDSNNILPVGTYTAKVSASNAYGTGTNSTSVYISSNNGNGNCSSNYGTPNLTNVNASPSNFNPYNQSTTIYYNLDRSANVTVEILNGNSSLMRTLSDNVCRNSGSGSYSWDGRDMYGNTVGNGTYTARVTANNGSGTDTEYTYVTVDNNGNNGGNNNGNLILNMYVQPEIFNPRSGQTSTVYYNLNQTATVTTQVLDRNGVVIRTLVDNITRYSNNYAYNTSYGSYNYGDQWNGRDVYGNIVPDNVYQFRVTANANGQTDTKTAWVEVNTDGNIIGFPNGSTCGNYIDVTSNSPYCKAIQLMTDNGVFSGYSDGTFRPYDPINRAETVKVILLALGIPVTNDGSTLFFDTDGNAWYAPYLRTAKRLGIIRGYPDGSFRPNQTINRVELLKVFLESSGVNIPYCNYAPYNDTPVNADTRWYIDYACYAKSNGRMHDDGSGRFSPAAAMTRGDVADLFYQFETKGLYNQTNNPYINGNNVYGYNNTNQNCVLNSSYYNCGSTNYNNNNNTNYNSYPVVTSVSASPSNFNPYAGDFTTIYYTVNQANSVQVQITDSNGSIRRSITGLGVTNSYNNSTSWNGRDNNGSVVPTGTYTVRVTGTNNYGSGSATTTVYVNNNNNGTSNNGSPIVSSITANPVSFSASNGQSTTVTYSLNITGSIVVQVLDSYGNVRRTISNGTAYTNTSNSVTWNGRDDSNNVLPTGSYTVKVSATNYYGTGSNSVGVNLY